MSVYVNGYISNKKIPEKVWIGKISLENRVEDRIKLQQAKCTLLNLRGINSCVAPLYLQKEGYDIVFLGESKAREIRKVLGDKAQVTEATEMQSKDIINIISRSWKNSVRTYLLKIGHLRFRDEYIHQSEIRKQDKFKKSNNIQADIHDLHLFLWIKLKHKVMENIDNNHIKASESSEVFVRVLPKWRRGRLKGRGEWTMEEKPSSYWKRANKITFVEDVEEIVQVEFSTKGSISEFSYPKSCVFKEYKHSQSPEFLKIAPHDRIRRTEDFLDKNFRQIQFLGDVFTFNGPINLDDVSYSNEEFSSEIKVQVLKKENNKKESELISHCEILRKLGNRIFPLGDTVKTDYIIIKPKSIDSTNFVSRLEEIYKEKNFGELSPFQTLKPQSTIINGIVDIEKKDFHEYEKTVFEIQEIVKNEEIAQLPFCIVILPSSENGDDIYYGLRKTFFSPISKEFPTLYTQSIEASTVDSFNKNMKDFSIHNILGQIYTKAGKEGVVPWILGEPGDGKLSDFEGGVTCYSYFDVSRRYERKTHSSVFTAITDSYGRFVFSGNFPSGSEKLEIYTAYEMLLSILRRSVQHSTRVRDLSDFFRFKRLVFAKDGIMYESDAEVIKTAFYEGIKDQNRKPIEDLLKIDKTLPKSLVVDLVGVNKSPKKEIYMKKSNSEWFNVKEGTFVKLNDKQGLLVSSKTRKGTNIPLEISLLDHLNFHCQVSSPSIEEIAQEYYNLTFLNWNSLHFKSKYSLPQIITQAIGENLTAGVEIPENYLCI